MTDTPFQKTADIMGKTADAMREAPRGAIYVWCSTDMRYPKELAVKLKRTDLNIQCANIFDNGGNRLRGLPIPVVLDHATLLTEDQNNALQKWRAIAAGGR